MSRQPTRAVVALAALDLRRTPDHRSELKSQLLLGEVVRVLGPSRDGQWWRVRNEADGYTGWARTWGLVGCSPARAARWRARARGRAVESYAEVRAGRGRGPLVSPMFWHNQVIAGPARGGFRAVELPDGRRGLVEAGAVRTAKGPGIGLVERVQRLLGVPYLWGGRTPLGFDCSGLVQLLLAEQGLMLPRDARDQFRVSGRIAAGEARLGDLVFFGIPGGQPAHVGMALGGGLFVHARGRVRINSVQSDNHLCDRALLEQCRGFRRPPGASVLARTIARKHP